MTEQIRLEWRDPQELSANPRNWRRHPQAQTRAMKDLLQEIGWAGALLYNERTGHLIDGHLRKELATEKVPVLIGSWDEETERKILLTLDPLAYMAEHDEDMLLGLLEETSFDSEAVNEMLEALANGERQPMPDFEPASEDEQGRLDEKKKVECPECGHEFTP